jgi:hypothetical protein
MYLLVGSDYTRARVCVCVRAYWREEKQKKAGSDNKLQHGE